MIEILIFGLLWMYIVGTFVFGASVAGERMVEWQISDFIAIATWPVFIPLFLAWRFSQRLVKAVIGRGKGGQ